MRSLLSVCDIEDEVTKILDIASDFKAGKMEEKPLKHLQEQEFPLKLECTN